MKKHFVKASFGDIDNIPKSYTKNRNIAIYIAYYPDSKEQLSVNMESVRASLSINGAIDVLRDSDDKKKSDNGDVVVIGIKIPIDVMYMPFYEKENSIADIEYNEETLSFLITLHNHRKLFDTMSIDYYRYSIIDDKLEIEKSSLT